MAQPDFILSLDGVPHDDLRVLAFEGHGAVSEPYRFTLELVSGDPDLALETLLQRPAFLRLTTQGERGIHGLVGRIEQIDCRSEERRVGKECRAWWSTDGAKKNRDERRRSYESTCNVDGT